MAYARETTCPPLSLPVLCIAEPDEPTAFACLTASNTPRRSRLRDAIAVKLESCVNRRGSSQPARCAITPRTVEKGPSRDIVIDRFDPQRRLATGSRSPADTTIMRVNTNDRAEAPTKVRPRGAECDHDIKGWSQPVIATPLRVS
jgi:hypothetical protein